MESSDDTDILPYEIHTNHELEFMLHRGKPLACFCDVYPEEPSEEIIPEESFAPHVESGLFIKREYVQLNTGGPPKGFEHLRGTRYVFYAPPSEVWRIDAFIEMQFAAAQSGWSEEFERLEGKLLGYEDWQTDIHLERLRRCPHAKNFYWLQRT